MAGTAAAASGVLTVMRTISEPARASSLTWIAVPITSAVSVFVIDCTTARASTHTRTLRSPCRTSTPRLGRRARGPEGMGMLVEVMLRCIPLLRSLLHVDQRVGLARHQRQRHRGPAQAGRDAIRV